MNEAYEVELTNLEASFSASPFNLVLGVEKQTMLKIEESGVVQGFTDVEWQVIYARVLIDERWYFLRQEFYDEIDDVYGDTIGEELWKLTNRLM